MATCSVGDEREKQRMDDARCCECNCPVLYETGFTISGTLAEGSKDSLYCPQCAPDQGRGWTLSDLERMREESARARRDREVRLMEQLGPDVYFFVADAPPNADGAG